MGRITKKAEQSPHSGKTGLWPSQSVSKAERRDSRVHQFGSALGDSFASSETKEPLQPQYVHWFRDADKVRKHISWQCQTPVRLPVVYGHTNVWNCSSRSGWQQKNCGTLRFPDVLWRRLPGDLPLCAVWGDSVLCVLVLEQETKVSCWGWCCPASI